MKFENDSFIYFEKPEAGLIFCDVNHDKYPIRYYHVVDGKGCDIQDDCSYYGYCYDGMTVIGKEGMPDMPVSDGMYFSLSDGFKFYDNPSKVILIEVLHTEGEYPINNFRASSTFGGVIEDIGRLKYIDGCSDSLLIPPVKMGDPCLNHLHFPDSIDQTEHTHPSHRIGIVAKGSGKCKTPYGNLPLSKGMIFVIKEWNFKDFAIGEDGKEHPVGAHCFQTFDEGMDVIAFHPDSDFGATDVNHPMINKTFVDGVSASQLKEYQTKEL
jgi:hypothetical protein